MTTSPFSRLTTTPEQPPGQPSFTPLFVSFSNKGTEISDHCSAASVGIERNTVASTTAVPTFRGDLWNMRLLFIRISSLAILRSSPSDQLRAFGRAEGH